MSLGQSVRKFVKHTILRRPRPPAAAAVEPYHDPTTKFFGGPHSRGHTRPRNWWLHRKSRLHMARESRRRNRG